MFKKENLEIERFKKGIREMHRGYPNYLFTKQFIFEKISSSRHIVRKLMDHGIIDNNEQNFMLGPTGISLVSSWNAEDSAKQTKILTRVICALTFGLLAYAILTYIQLL